jgi:hypothetical protein
MAIINTEYHLDSLAAKYISSLFEQSTSEFQLSEHLYTRNRNECLTILRK